LTELINTKKQKIDWFPSKHGWHVFWAVPLAVCLGMMGWNLNRIFWCGFGGCGFPYQAEQQPSMFMVVFLIFCSVIPLMAAVIAPPWVKPLWLRVIVAVLIVPIDLYFFGWGSSPSPVPFLPTYDMFMSFIYNS